MHTRETKSFKGRLGFLVQLQYLHNRWNKQSYRTPLYKSSCCGLHNRCNKKSSYRTLLYKSSCYGYWSYRTLLWLHCRPICNMFTIRRGGGCKRDSSRAARADAVRKLTYRSILNIVNVKSRLSHDVYFILSRSLCDTHPDKIDWGKLWQLQNGVVESVRRSFLIF